MKQKKREEIARTIVRLGVVKTYGPADLGVTRFRKVTGVLTAPETRCILVSTEMRDKIIKLLGERL